MGVSESQNTWAQSAAHTHLPDPRREVGAPPEGGVEPGFVGGLALPDLRDGELQWAPCRRRVGHHLVAHIPRLHSRKGQHPPPESAKQGRPQASCTRRHLATCQPTCLRHRLLSPQLHLRLEGRHNSRVQHPVAVGRGVGPLGRAASCCSSRGTCTWPLRSDPRGGDVRDAVCDIMTAFIHVSVAGSAWRVPSRAQSKGSKLCGRA